MPMVGRCMLIAVALVAGPGPAQQPAGSDPAPAKPTDPPPPHVRLAVAEERFRVYRTEHFVVSHDTTADVLRALISRLDRVHGTTRKFAEARGLLKADRPAAPLDVLVLDQYDAYVAFAQARGENAAVTGGFYHLQDNFSVFYNTLTRPDLVQINRQIEDARTQMLAMRNEGRNGAPPQLQQLQRQIDIWQTQRDGFVEQANRVALMHEAAHQCLFNFGVHNVEVWNPTWLVEGLACQFEIPQTVSGERLARPNVNRLRDLREAWPAATVRSNRSRPPRWSPGAQVGPVPLRELLTQPLLLSDRARPDIVRLYAQSWALVYYLQSQYSDEFTRYLRGVGARPARTALAAAEELTAFETCFGPPDEGFEQHWGDFLLSLKAD